MFDHPQSESYEPSSGGGEQPNHVHFASFIDESEFASLIDVDEHHHHPGGSGALNNVPRHTRGLLSQRWRRIGENQVPSSLEFDDTNQATYYAATGGGVVPPCRSFDSRTDGSVGSELGGLIPKCDSRDWVALPGGIPKADSRDWASAIQKVDSRDWAGAIPKADSRDWGCVGIPKADSQDWMPDRRHLTMPPPPSHQALRGLPQFNSTDGNAHQLEDLLSILASQVSSPIDNQHKSADIVVGEVSNALGLSSSTVPQANEQEIESERESPSERSDSASENDGGSSNKRKRKNGITLKSKNRSEITAKSKKRIPNSLLSAGGFMMGYDGIEDDNDEEDDDEDEEELAPEEKAELTRQRNREHARSTRKRKKQYVDQLKRQVAELLAKQQMLNSMNESQDGSICKISPERQEEIRLRKKLVSDFLTTRLNDCRDRDLWRRLVDDHVKTTRPRTPYRAELPESCLKTPTSGQHSVLRLKGIDALIRDSISITEMCRMIQRRIDKLQAKNFPQQDATIILESDCNHEDILLVGDRCMGHWRIRSNGLVKHGLRFELELDGFVRANFHKNRLRDIELCFDPNTWAHQLIVANLLDLSMFSAEAEVRRDKNSGITTTSEENKQTVMSFDEGVKHSGNKSNATNRKSSMLPPPHPGNPATVGLLGLHHVLGMNPLVNGGQPQPPIPRPPPGFRPPPGVPFAPPFVRPPIFLGNNGDPSSNNKSPSGTGEKISPYNNATTNGAPRPPFFPPPPMLIPPIPGVGTGRNSPVPPGPLLPPPPPMLLQRAPPRQQPPAS